MSDEIITSGMLADKMRGLVLAGENACIKGTPMIPLHRATVTSIYMHLERLAKLDGEKTLGALEWELAASADTRRMAETGTGSGRSPSGAVPAEERGDAQPPPDPSRPIP